MSEFTTTDSPGSILDGVVGIIGFGHLGEALAEILIEAGLPKERLRISFGGSEATLGKIRKMGFEGCIADNATIASTARTIFVALRPVHYRELAGVNFSRESKVVSCMAGVSIAALKNSWGKDVVRFMLSGPDTLKVRRGLAAIYPSDRALEDLAVSIRATAFVLGEEREMHCFTAGVCLTSAFLVAERESIQVGGAIVEMSKQYADFARIYEWAMGNVPHGLSQEEYENYIRKMSTKGGITEAIVQTLRNGGTFLEALQSGVKRSEKLSRQF